MRLTRTRLAAAFAGALAFAQLSEEGAARLDLAIDPLMPARVYLFKDGRPFRLSPVGALLPLRVDLFYRERLWRGSADPDTLEVTALDQSHFILLKGRAEFSLPAGRYRVEAYRGMFYTPASADFELKAGERRGVSLKLAAWTRPERWISSDDHIHLTRAREDDAVFLGWLAAEDLSVGNFLQLQRQMDAAPQYGFGPQAEARRPGYSIRSGHESRSEFFGHVNLLGGREIVRPLSIGTMYANSPVTYPYPAVLFARGRELGATVGYAHFQGSMPHSTLLMDLALGNIDFIEVFQFGVLKTDAWYELLNAGLRVTGIAGSDFPVPLNRSKTPWPRSIPLLGPERALVPAAGAPSYDAWAAGVRSGNVVVTNGPIVEVAVAGSVARATASFSRALERLEIVVNGRVVASASGPKTALETSAKIDAPESVWVAARASAPSLEGEPEIRAHTNPTY
ncbi:MAG: CehA/McbA family metallohydrolase, partial [Bryobacteraceae bacterium]